MSPHPDIPALLAKAEHHDDLWYGTTTKELVKELIGALRTTHEARVRAEQRYAELECSVQSGAWAKSPPNMRWAQVQRLRFIAHRVETTGRVNRSDLVNKFQISVPQASVDLREFQKCNPGVIEYNPSAKQYALSLPQGET